MAVVQNYLPGDPLLIDKIVYELKSQGIFDQFRKECIADVDTKPAYQNLRQRVEGSVSGFLSKQKWSSDMNKNQVREMLRKNIYESGFLETGVERIVDQVVNPKMNSIFLPKVTEVVYKFLGIDKPTSDNKNNLKLMLSNENLLPTDLEAVSPESEKKFDISNDSQTLDDSKIDEDESPPFEPLEEKPIYVPPEENSVDSHLSGFSGLMSHDSNHSQENSKPIHMEILNQDSTLSKPSSESRLSIVMSDDNETKMEICDDSIQQKTAKLNEPVKTFDFSPDITNNSVSKRSESKVEDRSKSDRSEKNGKSSKSHDRSRSHHDSRSNDKRSDDKRSDRDRKDQRSKHSSRDKGKERKNTKNDSGSKSDSKNEKDSKSHNGKSEKDKSKSKHSSSSSSSKDKERSSTSRKDCSSSKDRSDNKDKSKSSSSNKDKDLKHKDEKGKGDSRSSSSKHDSRSDKHRRDDKHKTDKHTSQSSTSKSKDKEKKDSKKDKRENKDDHFSSKKKPDRRSTDRDSNDGHSGLKSSSSSFDSTISSQTQSKSQESSNSNSNNGSGESGNSDAIEELICDNIEDKEVIVHRQQQSLTIPSLKLIKPKFASNIHEARRLMKIRKQLSLLEKQSFLGLSEIMQKKVKENNKVKESKVVKEVKKEKNKSIAKNNQNIKKQINNLNVETSPDRNRKEATPQPPSPPLKSAVVSAATWDALEAKLHESINYTTGYDELDTSEEVVQEITVNKDDCLYLNSELNEKTERYKEFTIHYIKKLENRINRQLWKQKSLIQVKQLHNNHTNNINKNLKRKFTDYHSDMKNNNRKKFNTHHIEVHESFSLPLSPAESDNSIDKKSDVSDSSEKSIKKAEVEFVERVKKTVRVSTKNQRYSSEDLYKPRPIFGGSRRRNGRNLGLD